MLQTGYEAVVNDGKKYLRGMKETSRTGRQEE